MKLSCSTIWYLAVSLYLYLSVAVQLSTIGLAYKSADTLCEMLAGGKNKHINKKQN